MLEIYRRQIVITDDKKMRLLLSCRFSFRVERPLVSKIEYEHPLRNALVTPLAENGAKPQRGDCAAVRPLIRVYTDVKLPQVDREQIPEVCVFFNVDQGGTRFSYEENFSQKPNLSARLYASRHGRLHCDAFRIFPQDTDQITMTINTLRIRR